MTQAFCSALILISLSADAGQVFRFQDKNGVITLSKALPPYAAQKGYDILDDNSLRVIEKVAPALTKAEIDEYNRQQAAQKEQQRLTAIKAKEDSERRRQALLYDNNLRASYRSEEDLLKKREAELLYFQNQIDKTNTYLERNSAKLHQFQQQAAEIELGGRTVSGNLKKSLIAIKQEIHNNQLELERLTRENEETIKQFDRDQQRLKALLGGKQN
jgi:FtsZ-binding cell division protein ZapB